MRATWNPGHNFIEIPAKRPEIEDMKVVYIRKGAQARLAY